MESEAFEQIVDFLNAHPISIKRIGQGFSGKETPLVPTMIRLSIRREVESLVRATTIASSLEAEQESGDGHMRQNTMGDTSAHTWVISSSNNEALDKEDTSKQGRIYDIDADEDIALVSTHDDVSTQDNIIQDEGIEDVGEEDVFEVVTIAKMIIDTIVDVAQVTTGIADIPVSVVETIVTTALTITAKSIKTNV
nr:hypothetical protein [Tanacetum cinerariifolium]